ncbi:hypothetical protein TRIATDRAFT_258161 [Trichoderma atroviride IMI 206040]|uniref:Uncharacterized protein n=1 Tax=Hypocrea atroviridis (strain ATCC 20476 / IMI 206040) TaxID=452589 RepID=G9P309_HYPAI|nr:uncharacterized protein TRIATDRAFT_258161 [Trichoderma atroviride IMI 206040]EHK42782.1 hypothetical protein TRIATDRAFT_258161 [Trichoderma atroviride IMI 206040]
MSHLGGQSRPRNISYWTAEIQRRGEKGKKVQRAERMRRSGACFGVSARDLFQRQFAGRGRR